MDHFVHGILCLELDIQVNSIKRGPADDTSVARGALLSSLRDNSVRPGFRAVLAVSPTFVTLPLRSLRAAPLSRGWRRGSPPHRGPPRWAPPPPEVGYPPPLGGNPLQTPVYYVVHILNVSLKSPQNGEPALQVSLVRRRLPYGRFSYDIISDMAYVRNIGKPRYL